MAGPLLNVSNLTVDFRTDDGVVQAVRGVNFSVEPGKVLAVVGDGGFMMNAQELETAVRLIHLPTGITAQWSRERSLKQNRESALARLVKRIEAHFTIANIANRYLQMYQRL